MKKILIKIVILQLFAFQTYASEDNRPPTLYWRCVTNLENITDEQLLDIKDQVLRSNAGDKRVSQYIALVSTAAVKSCDDARKKAVEWRAAYKKVGVQEAEEAIAKMDALAPDMIRINLGQAILFAAEMDMAEEK